MIGLAISAAIMVLPPLTAPEKQAVDCLRVAAWLDRNATEARDRDAAQQITAFYIGELHILNPTVHWPNAAGFLIQDVPSDFALRAGRSCIQTVQDEITPIGKSIVDPAIRISPFSVKPK